MDLVNKVYDALKPIHELRNLPLSHLVRPTTLPGTSFHIFNTRPTLFGDGIAIRFASQCQVDVWSKNAEFGEIPEEIKRSMLKAGFMFMSDDMDIERNIGIYRKLLIFNIEYGAEV